jgi:shikimate kinase
MQLVFLYGPPGVGKLTVGTELARLTGFRLFHNHLSVNLVSAVFERDSEIWLQLLRQIRRDVLTQAARHQVNLIMTGVYSGTPEHAAAWQTMLEPVRSAGGSVVFGQLVCERDELFRRVQNANRRALDKLVDAERLMELLERFDLTATAPFEPRLRLDLTHLAPAAAAASIATHYGLPTVGVPASS